MIVRSDQEIWEECDRYDDAWVEARLKAGYFVDNPAAAHEWLIRRQREADDSRLEREMSNTRRALYVSFGALAISLFTAIWQVVNTEGQQTIAAEQLAQQKSLNASQLTNAKSLLGVQISVQLDNQFDSPGMRHARRQFAEQLAAHKDVSEMRVLDFFEKLGVYNHRNIIDKEILFQTYSYWLERYWLAAKPLIADIRSSEHDVGYYSNAEELAGQMLAEDKKNGVSAPNKAEINRFLREEMALLR